MQRTSHSLESRRPLQWHTKPGSCHFSHCLAQASAAQETPSVDKLLKENNKPIYQDGEEVKYCFILYHDLLRNSHALQDCLPSGVKIRLEGILYPHQCLYSSLKSSCFRDDKPQTEFSSGILVTLKKSLFANVSTLHAGSTWRKIAT